MGMRRNYIFFKVLSVSDLENLVWIKIDVLIEGIDLVGEEERMSLVLNLFNF